MPVAAVWIHALGSLFTDAGMASRRQSARASEQTAMRVAAQEQTTEFRSPESPSQLERGRQIFARQCALCHGDAGDGGGRFAYLMNPRPRDFKKGKFKLVTTVNRNPSDADLLRVIRRGMPGSAMPPWGHLPEADLAALVAFVKSIRHEAVMAELEQGVLDGSFETGEVAELLALRTEPGKPLVVPPETAFDDLRWFHGRRVYLEACASCHGVDGHPVPEAVKYDEDGYPDPPRSFVNGIFKGGMDGPSLYARIVLGMPGTPMPAFEGIYSTDEMWDLIHYVQSLARSGSQDRAQLRQGTFSAPRVSSLPSGPADETWNQARPLYVAMTPLWWVDDRVEGLIVQALHDGNQLAFRLSWLDDSTDDRAVLVDEFRDAVAIQFALTPDPPFYMGDRRSGGGVNIWMWKADRQANLASGYRDVDAAYPDRVADMYPESAAARAKDMASTEWPHGDIAEHDPTFITAWGAGNLVADPTLKTPVECLTARGPGSLASRPSAVQLVDGQAAYERGVWAVQMQRTLELPCDHHDEDSAPERVFKSGDYLPVSFAIWNGAMGDRDGKKNISIWQNLVIE